MKSRLGKRDIIWGYIAKFLSICSGLITLPLVLRMLSESEIALNYLFLNLMVLMVLFDFGFSSQFSRNFAYIFGGAQEVTVIGVSQKISNYINYELLYQVIGSARQLYGWLTGLLLFVFYTLGTWYIYEFTEGFTLVKDAFLLWILFSTTQALNFYYRFYTPLLQGKGDLFTIYRIDVLCTVTRLVIVFTLLGVGFGLWSLVIGNIISILLSRMLYVRAFYTKEMIGNLKPFKNNKYNYFEITKKLWYNAKQSAIVSIAALSGSHLGVFFCGLFLTKTEVASYGLLTHIVNTIYGVAMSLFYSGVPIISSLKAQNRDLDIKKNFYFYIGIFYIIYIVGALLTIFALPPLLDVIRSNASLPAISIVSLYLLYKFLEGQHCCCSSTLIALHNKILDFHSSTLIAITNIVGIFLVLKYTQLGLLGIVVVQFLTALFYPNWKWPYELCKEFGVGIFNMIKHSFCETYNIALIYVNKSLHIFLNRLTNRKDS